ncbi:MAG: aromatic ring hydroxylase [Candidatus Azotimanducaceae bacterium]
MIRTGAEYEQSRQDGREFFMSGKRVKGIVTHPMFKSIIDVCARINEINSEFSDNIKTHINKVFNQDFFQVSANEDRKGDRSKQPQDQDPDVLLHVISENVRKKMELMSSEQGAYLGTIPNARN